LDFRFWILDWGQREVASAMMLHERVFRITTSWRWPLPNAANPKSKIQNPK
jgi:hypothetical protein